MILFDKTIPDLYLNNFLFIAKILSIIPLMPSQGYSPNEPEWTVAFVNRNSKIFTLRTNNAYIITTGIPFIFVAERHSLGSYRGGPFGNPFNITPIYNIINKIELEKFHYDKIDYIY